VGGRRGTEAGVTDVLVSVDDAALGRFDAVVAALERAGLRVTRTLPRLGTVTGTAEDPAALEAVDGVAAVERGRTVRLPPPDAPVQ
jgi:hypothetical protein